MCSICAHPWYRRRDMERSVQKRSDSKYFSMAIQCAPCKLSIIHPFWLRTRRSHVRVMPAHHKINERDRDGQFQTSMYKLLS
jgi:hypothetical protein